VGRWNIRHSSHFDGIPFNPVPGRSLTPTPTPAQLFLHVIILHLPCKPLGARFDQINGMYAHATRPFCFPGELGRGLPLCDKQLERRGQPKINNNVSHAIGRIETISHIQMIQVNLFCFPLLNSSSKTTYIGISSMMR
jgi:hypothetical protein